MNGFSRPIISRWQDLDDVSLDDFAPGQAAVWDGAKLVGSDFLASFDSLADTDVTGALGYTPESAVNKATSFSMLNDTLYPTTLAVSTYAQPKDATLTALASFNSNGLIAQTAADTFAARTITGTTNQVNVANGNGVSGNPTLSLPQSIHTAAAPQFASLGLGTTAPAAGLAINDTTARFLFTKRVSGDGLANSTSPPDAANLFVYGAGSDYLAFTHFNFGAGIHYSNSNRELEFWGHDQATGYHPILTLISGTAQNQVQWRKRDDTTSLRFIFPDTGDPTWSFESGTFNLAFSPSGDLKFTPTGNVTVTPAGGAVNLTGNFTLASGQILLPDGTANNPALSFSGDTDTGILRPGNNAMDFITGTGARLRINALGLILGATSNSNGLNWTATNPGGTVDVGLTRNSAGVLEIHNGTPGTFRDLTLRNLTASGDLAIGSTVAISGTNTMSIFASSAATKPFFRYLSTGTGTGKWQYSNDGSTIVDIGGNGAHRALDNLASVAINTSLLSGTDDTDSLGSGLFRWKNLFISGFIGDASENEILKVASVASAVNEFTVTNAATGNGPIISATGDDTNIDLNFASKGTGSFYFDLSAENRVVFDSGSGFGIGNNSAWFEYLAGPGFVRFRLDRAGNTSSFAGDGLDLHSSAVVGWNGDTGIVRDAAGVIKITAGGGGGSIKTADPTSGIGDAWRFGSVKSGAVTPDTMNYVEIAIAGSVVKLIKAA